MKKGMIMLLVLCLALTSANALAEDSKADVTDFKSFYWGASMEDVKAIEGEPITTGEVSGLDAEYIVYETSAVGFDMILAYYFCDDGLFQVRYILNEEHSNDSLFIDDYEKFRNALTKKYGEPLIDKVSWDDSSTKKYYEENGKSMGDALRYGYCSYLTRYDLERSYISMDMSADNYEVSMTVNYESKTVDPGETDYSDEI